MLSEELLCSEDPRKFKVEKDQVSEEKLEQDAQKRIRSLFSADLRMRDQARGTQESSCQ